MKNTSTIMNLSITVEIAVMLIGETLERITIETWTGEETEEVKARAPVKTTYNSTKTEYTR